MGARLIGLVQQIAVIGHAGFDQFSDIGWRQVLATGAFGGGEPATI